VHFLIDELEFPEQIGLGVTDSFLLQPFCKDSCDYSERLACALLGLDERVVEIEYDRADFSIGQYLSIPNVCFWPAIREPFFTQSTMKREINVIYDYSLSSRF
jgi:hypothetical protein